MAPIPLWLSVAIQIALLLLTAYFSMLEVVAESLNESRLERLKDEGSEQAERLLPLLPQMQDAAESMYTMGTLLNLFMTSLCAFVLSRRRLPYKKALALLVLFTMYFSGGLIPRYLIISGLGLLDSYFAILLPTAISTYNMIVMRTSFENIPECLEESAAIDGANDLIILTRIILPLSMPVIAVMLLFYGVGHWNSWFNAMIYLRTRTKYPLQLILREILITNSLDSMTTDIGSLDKEPIGETIKYATIIVATLPVLFIYPFLQKYFTKGIMLGAVKS